MYFCKLLFLTYYKPRAYCTNVYTVLQGLDDLPLERSKYYALLNDMEYGKSIPIFAICNVNRIHQMISRIFCNYEFDLKKFVVS